MGAACCKPKEAAYVSSPHLPFCEVVRRCARMVCPVDPPRQKPDYRTRKYGLSDIVGPVSKKDSWVQTDPLPPPRRRKRKEKQRRRSRSVEFLPYLIRRESSKGSEASKGYGGSLEDIPGQEDALDFQMYFMSRLPRNSVDEEKVRLSGRKRQFLSGLLGDENINKNNNNDATKKAEVADESIKREATKVDTLAQQAAPAPDVGEKAQDSLGPEVVSLAESGSRRSSITESLREFESSLLDMLEEDDVSLPRDPSREDEVRLAVPVVRKLCTPSEEKDEGYVITPIEEEPEEELEEGKVGDQPKDLKVDINKSNGTPYLKGASELSKGDQGKPETSEMQNQNENVINTNEKVNKPNENLKTPNNEHNNLSESSAIIEEIKTIEEKLIDQSFISDKPNSKNQPPTITVEIVS